MNELNIAGNIIRLRHERKVTQKELADFIGVTKASVSKWESGKSIPDVLLLPQIAAFFGVTVDELIGYQVRLSREQIQKIYGDLCTVFTEQPFEEAMREARMYVHRYYSCYPFLLQMGVLYLNHAVLAKTKDACRNVLEEAVGFMDHIIDRCTDASVCEDAISMKATLYLQLGKTKEALALLEDVADPCRISSQNDIMLVQAYWQAGELENAKSHVQIRIYTHLLSIISGEMLFLALHEDDLKRCEETIRRVKGMIELYQLKELHPNLTAQFYFQSALVYGAHGRNEDVLTELKEFTDCTCAILNAKQRLLHGDWYFDRLEEWIDRLPLGDMAPKDLSFVRQSTLQALSHPSFAGVTDREEFRRLYAQIAGSGTENIR
ncbi:MAG: helix-turn-helix domain-containing protein [Butyricicoccus sp.]